MREETNMTNGQGWNGDWTRIPRASEEGEELLIDYDDTRGSVEYEPTQAELDGIDWDEILDSITCILRNPFDAECVKPRLLDVLANEKENCGLRAGTLIDDFIARVKGDDFGAQERDEIVAKLILILGWNDCFVTWPTEQLRGFLNSLVNSGTNGDYAGRPVYNL